jgi:hypothetical protein
VRPAEFLILAQIVRGGTAVVLVVTGDQLAGRFLVRKTWLAEKRAYVS